MKSSYVLDESVAHCAATGQNETGEDDLSALKLIDALYRGRYESVFSNELYNNWIKVLSSLADSSTPVVPVMSILFRYLNSIPLVEDPPEFDGEEQAPADDIYWIRLAIHTHSIGVTTDNRLMEALEDASIIARHSLTLLRPEDALSRLP